MKASVKESGAKRGKTVNTTEKKTPKTKKSTAKGNADKPARREASRSVVKQGKALQAVVKTKEAKQPKTAQKGKRIGAGTRSTGVKTVEKTAGKAVRVSKKAVEKTAGKTVKASKKAVRKTGVETVGASKKAVEKTAGKTVKGSKKAVEKTGVKSKMDKPVRQGKSAPKKGKAAKGTPIKIEAVKQQTITTEIAPAQKGLGAITKKERSVKETRTTKTMLPQKEKILRMPKASRKKPVKIVFLGGVQEIGKNMTALEYGNDIIVIDAGLTFPSAEDMPGVDSVVPDVTYLTENKDKIKGIFITHGHEDHIGGLPYLLKEINPSTPVYGTRLTLMLADNKLQEHRLQGVMERVVSGGDRIKAGAFEVEFIDVNHSIAGSCALAIRTPNGLIYHSGDFKIDLTPVTGAPIDLRRIAELGDEGVLLYLAESTNIERVGYTMSETVVGTTLDHLFSENTNRRLIIATFASNVHRLQQIIDLAVKYRRKVALSGRSMFKVVEAAVKIGELKIPEGVLVDVEQTKNLFDGELVIVSTGSQGEPMSALTRMSMGEFNKVTVGPNDTIIISASPIPGNEKPVYRVINNLYKLGAKVVYESLEKIHVSGHACQEEHKILHSLLRPKFFIPVHGEYRHLKRHVDLAVAMGVPQHHTIIPELGNCVELTDGEMRLGENIPAGARLIDGEGIEEYGASEVMKDRVRMSTEGLFAVSLAVTGNYVINEPVIQSLGFVAAENKCTLPELTAVVQRAVEGYDYEHGNKDELCVCVKKALRNYLYKKTKQSPLILVTVLDI